MRIVDAHCHIGPAFATRPPMYPGVEADDIINLMDSASIDAACIFPPAWEGPEFQDPTFEIANAATAREAAKYPGRLLPYARVNPNFCEDAERELERCKMEYGCVGLKLHPLTEHFWAGNLTLLRPIFDRCVKWNWPVFFHSGYYPTCQPALFIPLAQAFPTVPIILAHLSYAHTADAIAVARRYPNIYLETSANSSSVAMREVYESIPTEQFLFGSDLPFTDPKDVLAKIQAIPDIQEEDLELILGGNMMRLLDIPTATNIKEEPA